MNAIGCHVLMTSPLLHNCWQWRETDSMWKSSRAHSTCIEKVISSRSWSMKSLNVDNLSPWSESTVTSGSIMTCSLLVWITIRHPSFQQTQKSNKSSYFYASIIFFRLKSLIFYFRNIRFCFLTVPLSVPQSRSGGHREAAASKLLTQFPLS